ncbi:hypothetical protein F5X99DRAFT_414888 [Biscogniauxia marginata]|nr:hypothetical protein F5X99DRAFT_414888 [Biscogniauxia marginata]
MFATHALTYLAVAAAALLQGVVASPTTSPTSLPGHYVCTSITTVTTTVPPVGQCRIFCPEPTSICKPGEPTRSYPSVTTPLPGCTEEVRIRETCGCATCALPTGAVQTA